MLRKKENPQEEVPQAQKRSHGEKIAQPQEKTEGERKDLLREQESPLEQNMNVSEAGAWLCLTDIVRAPEEKWDGVFLIVFFYEVFAFCVIGLDQILPSATSSFLRNYPPQKHTHTVDFLHSVIYVKAYLVKHFYPDVPWYKFIHWGLVILSSLTPLKKIYFSSLCRNQLPIILY